MEEFIRKYIYKEPFMGKFFDIDGGFFRFMTKVADFILLDVLVFLFSLPIVTIGPALTAMNYVALKEVRDEEGYLWRSFWKAFKQNFKQGFLIELIIIVAGAILFIDMRITYTWASVEDSLIARLLFFVLLGFTAVVAAASMYVFPMLAKFDNTVIKLVKNSILMCVKHLPQTIVMAIITYGLAYATFTYPLFILFSIGLAGYADAYILARVFDIYIPKKHAVEKEDDNQAATQEEETAENVVLTAQDMGYDNAGSESLTADAEGSEAEETDNVE